MRKTAISLLAVSLLTLLFEVDLRHAQTFQVGTEITGEDLATGFGVDTI